ncbi:MAG: hypothetical protein QOE05_1445 [Actinomycetota bacterium]|jgi:hypothetical protein|nr:hypothetical protein [Actinomycetota bacterium]
MTRVRRVGAFALVVIVAAGCGGSSGGSLTTTSSTGPVARPEVARVLPTAKDLLALEATTYRSPEGFVPSITVEVPAGWSSVHRYDDAFDITQPDPARDAPAVAVIWMTPDAPTAGAALGRLKGVAGAAAHPVTGRIGTTDALGMDVTDGTGTLVESVRKGISIDAAEGQRVRVLGADVGGKPLLVLILVPVAADWDAQLAKALPLVESVTPVSP